MHAFKQKVMVAVVLATAATAASAQGVPHVLGMMAAQPRVLWQDAPVYGGGGADVTASTVSWEAHPAHEIPIAQLTLPAGKYLVSAKLSVWTADAEQGALECILAPPGEEVRADYSSVDVNLWGGQKFLALELPVTVTAPTTVALACHFRGSALGSGGMTPATAHPWGAKIVALQVGSIEQQ